MNPKTLKTAINEAERFLAAARQVPTEELKVAPGVFRQEVVEGKEAAACKRASMDLSRALSEMRRPG